MVNTSLENKQNLNAVAGARSLDELGGGRRLGNFLNNFASEASAVIM